jgi:hypothetical protein
MRLYESHRLRVEDAQHASSVAGHVRGMMVDGTGFISGRTDTLHVANLSANRVAYSLIEVTAKLPIRIGDDLLVVCRQGKNGVWQVLSVANRSTKTSYALSPFNGLWFYWIGFLGALLSVLVLVGLVLAPMALYNALKFTQCDFAEMMTANETLGRIANLKNDAELEAAVRAFNQSPPKRLLELMFG